MVRLGLLLLSLLMASDGWAAGIGQVVLSVGDNQVLGADQRPRPLSRGMALYPLDTVSTGPRGRVHIKFSDGGSLALKPNSTFHVARYRYDAARPEQGQAAFQLLRGGMRTISGQIGKLNPADYQMRTLVATIGIRGTEYELYVCDRCCAQASDGVEGVAGGVSEGGIQVENSRHRVAVDRGRYFLIERGSHDIQLLDEAPAMLAIGQLPAEPQPVAPAPEPEPEPEPEMAESDCGSLCEKEFSFGNRSGTAWWQ